MTRLAFGGNVRRTFCTLCPQHCGMLIEVDEAGHPVRFDGDRENPVAKGKLCIKGTACIELHDHPFFVASQFHPEFKSRPEKPAPLFRDFVAAAKEYATDGAEPAAADEIRASRGS